MVNIRYRTAAVLALSLLLAGGVIGYFVDQSRARTESKPAQNEANLPQAKERLQTPEFVPAIEVVTMLPGAAPEEVERQVTIPLEVCLAGMPGLESLRSNSHSGASMIRAEFKRGSDYTAARQEVINRLQFAPQLPAGAAPMLSPRADHHSLWYILRGPRDESGKPIYNLRDLAALQEGILEREFRRLPGIIDVASSGGTKRYEIQLDFDRMKRFGITLQQVQDALTNSGLNAGADYVLGGQVALNVRNVGLLGGGLDPFQKVLNLRDPDLAAAKQLEEARREKKLELAKLKSAQARRLAQLANKILREEEDRQVRDIRKIAITKVNETPILIDDVVAGGKLGPTDQAGKQGVIVASRSKSDEVTIGEGATSTEEVVQGIVLLRPMEDPELLKAAQRKVQELNESSGRMLPGVTIEPFYCTLDKEKNIIWCYAMMSKNVSKQAGREFVQKVQKTLCSMDRVDRVVSQAYGPESLNLPNQFQFSIELNEPRAQRAERMEKIRGKLQFELPEASWLISSSDPGGMDRLFPGIAAEHLLKIAGPDLAELDRAADSVTNSLRTIEGVTGVARPFSNMPNLSFKIDLEKCKRWGVRAADVSSTLQFALQGKAMSPIIEGEKIFDLTISRARPGKQDESNDELLDMTIEIVGGPADKQAPIANQPRLRLRDVVTSDETERGLAASVIFREDGRRVLPIRFSVSGRPIGEIQAEAMKKIAPHLKENYRVIWAD
jgi:Cu/Ag efflux pump CusA